jgi:excisionase family DNA binding protein
VLGVSEAAERLGCTTRRVRQLASEDADEDRLQAVKIGVVWVFDAAEVERFIHARTRRPRAQTQPHAGADGAGRRAGA